MSALAAKLNGKHLERIFDVRVVVSPREKPVKKAVEVNDSLKLYSEICGPSARSFCAGRPKTDASLVERGEIFDVTEFYDTRFSKLNLDYSRDTQYTRPDRPFILPSVIFSRSRCSISDSHSNDPFISAEEKGTTASDKSGKDDRRDSKNHLSGRLFHVPHLFLHPLQRHLVDTDTRGAPEFEKNSTVKIYDELRWKKNSEEAKPKRDLARNSRVNIRCFFE
ncbi:hypothetical protein WN51_06238 [Melipona quadrifasciata]|uniref:Uncharacterized protein n=1 Tax=Melipona quadrifasciata TaxID=166423 RepID=A0A0M8ZUJ5_9HYME|nr:hypothetical protein WN51_06238 [Melipona quadrifasciata]